MSSISKLIFVCSLFLSLESCAQSRKSIISGNYRYRDSFLLAGQSLNLNKNGTFSYHTGTDLETRHSYGKWSLKGDTIALISSIKRNNIPISIAEKHIDSIKGNIIISLVENLDNEIMDAAFMMNGDTNKLCVPLLETGCDIKMGTIDSFRISFSNNTGTSWVKLKDKKTNFLKVIANVHDVLALYIFFDNEKFIYKDNTLKHLYKDNQSYRVSTLVREEDKN